MDAGSAISSDGAEGSEGTDTVSDIGAKTFTRTGCRRQDDAASFHPPPRVGQAGSRCPPDPGRARRHRRGAGKRDAWPLVVREGGATNQPVSPAGPRRHCLASPAVHQMPVAGVGMSAPVARGTQSAESGRCSVLWSLGNSPALRPRERRPACPTFPHVTRQSQSDPTPTPPERRPRMVRAPDQHPSRAHRLPESRSASESSTRPCRRSSARRCAA